MPPPFNALHVGYMRRYSKTQKSTILDKRQRLEARHKTGSLLPVTLVVSRVESGGEVGGAFSAPHCPPLFPLKEPL